MIEELARERKYIITKEDALRSVYFICRMTQNQNGKAMSGALSSKQDYIGGIFDRWINIIPESIIFNKGILPSIDSENQIEVITDFYIYDPSSDKAGIAPDVIGIRINNKVVPFARYNEKWTAEPNMPQIELKTFKQNDYMVSLRNQGYDSKYLVMVQSNFRVDYLVPFFESQLLNDSIFEQMQMDNDAFIVSNEKGFLSELKPVVNESDIIGDVSLITITRADCFMSIATKCESGVGVEWLKCVSECNLPRGEINEIPLTEICSKHKNGLFRFNSKWYSGIDDEGIPYKATKKKNGSVSITKLRTLDFFTDNVCGIFVLRQNKSSLKIRSNKDCVFNQYHLTANKVYQLDYSCLERGNNGNEFFMQKDLITMVDSKEFELIEKIQEIVKNNS